MLYPGTILYQDYDKFNKLYGTRKIETVFWNKVHAYPMHLSYQLSYDQAKYLSLLVLKGFLTIMKSMMFVEKQLLDIITYLKKNTWASF